MLSFCLVSSSTSRWAAVAVPLDLVLGVGQLLVGLGLRLRDDLVGVLLGVGDQLLGVLVSLAPGLLGLGAGLGGPLLGGGGPLLGLGDQLLGGRLGRGQPFCLLPLGFLPAGGQLDLELGLGLGALRLALLQDALRLAAHLVRLPLGGGEDLVPLPLRGRLELGGLALGGGPQLGDVALDRGALLGHLVVGGRAELGDLALGGRGQLVGLTAGAGADRIRVPLGRAALVVGFPLGDGAQLGGLVLGRGAQLGRVHLGGGLQLVRRGPRLTDDLGGLLLGEPEQLLDPRAEPGIGGALLLPDLPVCVGQFLLQRLDLVPVLTDFGVELLEYLVNLVLVVPAHDLGEVAGWCVFEEVAELGVNFRLHLA